MKFTIYYINDKGERKNYEDDYKDYESAFADAYTAAKNKNYNLISVVKGNTEQEALEYNQKVNANIASGKYASDVFKTENPLLSQVFPHLAKTNTEEYWQKPIDLLPTASNILPAQKDVWSLPGRALSSLLGTGYKRIANTSSEPLGMSATVENDSTASFLRDPVLPAFGLASAAFVPSALSTGLVQGGPVLAGVLGGLTEGALGAGSQLALGKKSEGLPLATTITNMLGGGLFGGLQAKGVKAGVEEMFPKASSGAKKEMLKLTSKNSLGGNGQNVQQVMTDLSKQANFADVAKIQAQKNAKQFGLQMKPQQVIDNAISDPNSMINKLLPDILENLKKQHPELAEHFTTQNIYGGLNDLAKGVKAGDLILPVDKEDFLLKLPTSIRPEVNDIQSKLVDKLYQYNDELSNGFEVEGVMPALHTKVDEIANEMLKNGNKNPRQEFTNWLKDNEGVTLDEIKNAFSDATNGVGSLQTAMIKPSLAMKLKNGEKIQLSDFTEADIKTLQMAHESLKNNQVSKENINIAKDAVKEFLKQREKQLGSISEDQFEERLNPLIGPPMPTNAQKLSGKTVAPEEVAMGLSSGRPLSDVAQESYNKSNMFRKKINDLLGAPIGTNAPVDLTQFANKKIPWGVATIPNAIKNSTNSRRMVQQLLGTSYDNRD